MLKKVMAAMSPLRNVTSCIVLFAFLGLTAGIAFGVPFPSYDVDGGLVLPPHSPHSVSELVRMTRDDHPGVRVDGHGRYIEFSATGSLSGAWRAVSQATREVIAANNGKVKGFEYGRAERIPLSGYGLFGFLAGLGTALGFLVPPRWRVTAPA